MSTLRIFQSCICTAVLFLIAGHGKLLAQISVTQSSFQASFQQATPVMQFLSDDGEQIFELIAKSGANQVWDFSNLEILEERDGFFSVLGMDEGLPGEADEHLGIANVVTVFDFPIYNPGIGEGVIFYEIEYQYINLVDGRAFLLGDIVVEGDEINQEREDDLYFTWMDPAQVWLDFPVTYQKSWDSSYEISFSDFFMVTGVEEEAEVDGWGTVITAGGSIDVLRIRRKLQTTLFGITLEGVEVFEFFDVSGRLVASITGFFPGFDEDYDELEATWNVYSSPTSISLDDNRESPEGIMLLQNYPNPFNPATTIGYYLPEASDIRLTVHDMLGREVGVLAQGPVASGEHSVVFDASQLPGGVYMYRLTAGSHALTRKLTLIK